MKTNCNRCISMIMCVLMIVSIFSIPAFADIDAAKVGMYNGTYAGTITGSWEACVDSQGGVAGSAIHTDPNKEWNISGEVEETGSMSLGTAGISTFNGTIDESGNISGTWTNNHDDSGTFTGIKVKDTCD